MKGMRGSGLSLLLSFTIGAGGAGYLMTNAEAAPQPTTVNTVTDEATTNMRPTLTPTPQAESSSPGVEGDDGSLGGPVLNESNPVTPTYIVKMPAAQPTHEDANDDTATPTQAEVVATPTHEPEEVHETRVAPPTASLTPSIDEHKESASDTPAEAG